MMSWQLQIRRTKEGTFKHKEHLLGKTSQISFQFVSLPSENINFVCQGLGVSWIRGSSDSRTMYLAGLLDYEDTRLKTLSRVRVGLSFAWKASLAIRICRSPPL